MARRYKWDEIESIFIEAIDNAQAVNFYTRSIRLQKEQINLLDSKINQFKGFKNYAIKNKDEPMANALLGMQCMLSSLRSSLKCWISVKENNFMEAWGYLIDAHEYCDIAIKVKTFQGLENLKVHLTGIERSIFPHWALYNSIGVLETIGKCSICGITFNDCEHLEGEIYIGRLCQRVERNIIEVNHCALVPIPHDKRCILTHISRDGKSIDNFTHEPTGVLTDDKDGLTTQGVIMTTKLLDLD